MEQNTQAEPRKTNGFFKFIKTLFFIILTLAIGGGVVYGVARTKPAFLGLPSGSSKAVEDVDSLVKEVGKLIALPTDEKPTVATITDIEKIKDQQFFRNAANGDKVLIYTNNKKAILYRPSAKKIIEVGSININEQIKPSAPPAVTMSPVAAETIGPSATPVSTPVLVATPSPVSSQ